MMTLDEITKKVLEQIDASGFKQSGAFNLRHNGIALCHGDSEHIKIKKKQDKPGIDIYIDGKTDGAVSYTHLDVYKRQQMISYLQ